MSLEQVVAEASFQQIQIQFFDKAQEALDWLKTLRDEIEVLQIHKISCSNTLFSPTYAYKSLTKI